MSHFEVIRTLAADSYSIDAFSRSRFSQPYTIFDSKQTNSNLALLWDDVEDTGAGTASTWSQFLASSVLAVGATTAGKRTRQTFQRFNYQPGKGQLVLLSFTMGAAASGITWEAGQFDNANGVFLRRVGSDAYLGIRSSASGSPVDNAIPQASWNIDPFDGTGPSGVTLDLTKTQILVFDYEWLGAGRVRAGFVQGGLFHYAHEFKHANNASGVYMTTPNNPLRYSLENDGTGVASAFDTQCATVISEGGAEPTGLTRYITQNGGKSNANSVSAIYALVGIKLQTLHMGCHVSMLNMSTIGEPSDDYEWLVLINPVVAGTFAYNDLPNSCLQVAYGDVSGNPSVNTVTGGVAIEGGYVRAGKDSGATRALLDNSWHLGESIAHVRDTIVLCVQPRSANLDISGAMTIREAA